LPVWNFLMRAVGAIALAVWAACLFSPRCASAGTVLITEQEASLPAERVILLGSRGITRGPRIELVQPGERAYSPMRFQLKFQSFGGAKINTGSLRVIYLKTPEIDITPRVARFTQPTGIDIPDAEAPEGEHFLRIEISDSEGRTRSSVIALKISR
jgi:hypothetical protein